ncbi:hypothetical protein Aduo_000139 [Ancylostoma duodenale]
MTPFVGLIAFIFYVCASAQKSPEDLPNCWKTYNGKDSLVFIKDLIRWHFFQASEPLKPGMRYSCELERLAYNLVKDPLECVGYPYKFTFAVGAGPTSNTLKIANEWKEKIAKMGRISKFGYNTSYKNGVYRDACVYK